MGSAAKIWKPCLMVCALAGCTTTVAARRPLAPDKEAELNALLADRTATLTKTTDPRRADVRDVRLFATTVRFREQDPGSPPLSPRWLPETEAPLTAVQR